MLSAVRRQREMSIRVCEYTCSIADFYAPLVVVIVIHSMADARK